MEKINFIDLLEKDKIAALTSGINNRFGKALTLYAMKTGHPYTVYELAAQLETYLGEKLPFYCGRPFGYCKDSLYPIGAVLDITVRKQDKLVRAYSKTDEGEIYGDPSIARFLLLADQLDISLSSMNRATHTSGRVRHGYVVTKILDNIIDGEIRNIANISEDIKLNSLTVSKTLRHLRSIGFVDFDSVKTDRLGPHESGYSSVIVSDRDKLEKYISNPEELRKAILNRKGKIQRIGYILETLKKRYEEFDSKKLSEETGFGWSDCSSVVSVLCDLGIYKYKIFKGAEFMSSVKILDKGKQAFELAYDPIIKVSINPFSRYVRQEYREILDKWSSQMDNLFRREKIRYLNEKQLYSKESGEEKVRIIKSAIRNLNTSLFRIKDVNKELDKIGAKINKETTSNIIRELAKEKEVDKVREGFYKLSN